MEFLLVESNLELSATDEKLQSALTTALTEDKNDYNRYYVSY